MAVSTILIQSILDWPLDIVLGVPQLINIDACLLWLARFFHFKIVVR